MLRFRKLASSLLLIALSTAAAAGCGGDRASRSMLILPAPPAESVLRGLIGPEGLCFDARGNLYVGSLTGRITRVDLDGQESVFAETGTVLAGLAAGPGDEIYAAAFTAGSVLAVAQDGTSRIAASGLDGPNAIAFDRDQRAVVTSFGVAGRPEVGRIERDGTYRTLTREVPSPNGVAFGRDERLYVADTSLDRIVRMDVEPSGEVGPIEVYTSGIDAPDGIAFDENGDLFVASDGVWVVLADAERSTLPFAITGDVDGPASLAFGAGTGRDPRSLYFTNFGDPIGTGTSVAKLATGVPGLALHAP